jgi:hypothetical protein
VEINCASMRSKVLPFILPRALLPALFSWEKVPAGGEGLVFAVGDIDRWPSNISATISESRINVRKSTSACGVRRRVVTHRRAFTSTICSCATYGRVKRPLIRLRHLLPQLKSAGGEGLSIREYRILERGSRKCKDPETSDNEPKQDTWSSFAEAQDSLSCSLRAIFVGIRPQAANPAEKRGEGSRLIGRVLSTACSGLLIDRTRVASQLE